MDPISSVCASCGRVMAARLLDVFLLAMLFACATQAAMQVSLAQLMQQQMPRRLQSQKRGGGKDGVGPAIHVDRPDDDNEENAIGGNPCIDYPDHPFPCKTTTQCLPFRYICDKNFDCADGSDEDTKMCTASQRPPIDEIKAFLDKERKWLVPYLFKPEKDTETIAQWLAVSATVEDLASNMSWKGRQLDRMREFLMEVIENHDSKFIDMGMPRGDWPEVSYIFMTLIDTGFDPYGGY